MSSLAAVLNGQTAEEAAASLARCCGSRRWVEAMLAQRPFAEDAAVLAAADEIWHGLEPEDWLEAFSHHPRIGDRQLRRTRPGTAEWARQEQAAAATAEASTLERLAAGNRAYETRFGHVFLICATGKSAAEMLAALERRLLNSPDEELRGAAEEQRKITRLRLEKLAVEATAPARKS
jgi:2-oxo-4-hydroxy-4-carboxy-5-ureidoimidazoline decarboxylase